MGEIVCRQIPVKIGADTLRINMAVGAGVNLGDVSKAYVDAQDNALKQQILQINNDLLLQIGTETTERINNDNSILGLLAALDENKINDVLLNGESIVAVGRIANIPLATQSNAGAMSAMDKERLDLLATTLYLLWSNGAYEFLDAPENFSAGNFPTVQVGFLDGNPVDNPTISVGSETYDIYIAGVKPIAGEIFANDTCFVSFKTGRVDLFSISQHKAYTISDTPSNALLATEKAVKEYVDNAGGGVSDVKLNEISIVTDGVANIPFVPTISNNPLDTVLPTEKAVKSYIDTVQFITAAQGQGVWYYTSATTLSETKPTGAVNIPFALSGTTATSRTLTGTLPRGGFYSPSASYVKNVYLTGLQGSTTYNITFDYRIKGTQIWTTTQQLTTANGQTAASLTINIPSDSTYAQRINWGAGDTYTEAVSIAKTTTGNNHTVNISQVPASALYSFMQRNGGVLYSGDVFDSALNRTQADVNSGTPTITMPAIGGGLTLNYTIGKMFKHTATSNLTIALLSLPAGKTNVIGLELTNGGQYLVTHPVGCKFASGTAPTLTAFGKDILLYMYDGADIICAVHKDVR